MSGQTIEDLKSDMKAQQWSVFGFGSHPNILCYLLRPDGKLLHTTHSLKS